jgi:hypothetical protein
MTAQLTTHRRRASRTLVALALVAMTAALSAATPAAAAGGHVYSHGSLWCSGSQIAVGSGMMASLRSGESVRMKHRLHRWNGQRWVTIAAAPAVQNLPTSASQVGPSRGRAATRSPRASAG